MQYDEVREVLIEIIRAAGGRFRSAYQICRVIEAQYPDLWQQLRANYRVEEGRPEMGAGAGIYYSPATFVSQALEYFSHEESRVQKAWFDSTNVNFDGTDPGYKEGWLAIWTWREEVT